MHPRHLLLLLLLLVATPAIADKSFRVPVVRITADLATDGSMQVREERTYRFKGRFKFAYRTFARDERITYRDFQVSENGLPYTLDDSEQPGTYQVTQDSDEIEVRWFYRARNETRTFAIEYGVQDAVHRYRDAGVLYYKFIGEGFKKKTGQVDITVNPPAAVEDWKVRQWAHGPLWGESRTGPDGVVTATCTNLPRRRFFELRILYPPELFPAAVARSGYISQTVTEEEAAWAEEANAQRQRAIEGARNLKKRQGVALWVLPVVVLLFWGFVLRMWREQKTRFPDHPEIASGPHTPPDDLPPALVSYLVNSRTVAASSLMATLMDLGRRGFVEFREEYVAGTGLFGKEKWEPRHQWVLVNEDWDGLEPFERDLLHFVFWEMTGQRTGSVPVEAFKKHKSEVRKFFAKWAAKVKEEGKRRAWFAEESMKARTRGVWLAVALTVLGLVLLPVVHEVGLIAIIPGAILVAVASLLVRPTAEGARQLARWQGLRRHLKSRGFRDEDSSRVRDFLGIYIIYGVLFGLSKDSLKHLGGVGLDQARGMGWYYATTGPHGGDFGTSFSAAVSSVNSAMSSSTGAGGGASGGGGGGAGGGGGGAG